MKKSVFGLACCCLLCLQAAAGLRAETWYLIEEQEVRRLEAVLTGWETDRANWRTQAGALKAESANLNNQLLKEKETTRDLRNSFSEYEAETSILLSRKDTELAELKMKAEHWRGKARKYVLVIAGLLALAAVCLSLRIYRSVKP